MGVIPNAAALHAEREISYEGILERSLGPLVKARAFGMTAISKVEQESHGGRRCKIIPGESLACGIC
jgi:hypothetical protein